MDAIFKFKVCIHIKKSHRFKSCFQSMKHLTRVILGYMKRYTTNIEQFPEKMPKSYATLLTKFKQKRITSLATTVISLIERQQLPTTLRNSRSMLIIMWSTFKTKIFTEKQLLAKPTPTPPTSTCTRVYQKKLKLNSTWFCTHPIQTRSSKRTSSKG